MLLIENLFQDDLDLKVLVDHRERNLTALLEGICEEIEFVQLPVGDYVIIINSKGVIVERKTVNDFLSSIRSNRLWDQLLRILKTEKILGYTVKRRILLVHGNFEAYFWPTANLIQWSQLMGAYLKIIYVYNTPIIHAENDTAFKAFMKILMKREASGSNDKLPTAKWYKKPIRANLPRKDRKKYVLSSLPHIGNHLAENLLNSFETIANIACASVDELQKVPGIGEKTARQIYRSFH